MAIAELIAEEDGLIVDLVVGGEPEQDADAPARSVDTRRVAAVAKILRLLDNTPVCEPPTDLVASTLARIEAASR